MQRGSCGKILSLDLGFLIPSSRKMGFNLTANLSGGTAVNWVLRIDIQLRPIHKGIDSSRLSIRL